MVKSLKKTKQDYSPEQIKNEIDQRLEKLKQINKT